MMEVFNGRLGIGNEVASNPLWEVDGGPIGFHLAWHEARGGHDWDGDDALPVAWEMAQQKCQGAKEQVSHAGRSRRGVRGGI